MEMESTTTAAELEMALEALDNTAGSAASITAELSDDAYRLATAASEELHGVGLTGLCEDIARGQADRSDLRAALAAARNELGSGPRLQPAPSFKDGTTEPRYAATYRITLDAIEPENLPFGRGATITIAPRPTAGSMGALAVTLEATNLDLLLALIRENWGSEQETGIDWLQHITKDPA